MPHGGLSMQLFFLGKISKLALERIGGNVDFNENIVHNPPGHPVPLYCVYPPAAAPCGSLTGGAAAAALRSVFLPYD